MAFTPSRGGHKPLSSHISHKLLPTDAFLSRKMQEMCFHPPPWTPLGELTVLPRDSIAGLRGLHLKEGDGSEPTSWLSAWRAG